jgi:hypothetical protein
MGNSLQDKIALVTGGSTESPDIYDGAPWIEMHIEDLKALIEDGSSIEEVAQFLCRSGSVEEIKRKCEELGLKPWLDHEGLRS